ncbi:MAG: flagellar biosynthetic protein FliO, partial [Deltaproteobacteria bacterium]|nr:flagellar biosynthetic protein FliO [Deltaproteobacteria bacterium]
MRRCARASARPSAKPSAKAEPEVPPAAPGTVDHVAPLLLTGGGSLLQTLVALLLVCTAAYLLIRVWGRWRAVRPGPGRPLERVASLPLAAGASLHLVRAGSRLLLLGVTGGSVRLLGELGEAEAQQGVGVGAGVGARAVAV